MSKDRWHKWPEQQPDDLGYYNVIRRFDWGEGPRRVSTVAWYQNIHCGLSCSRWHDPKDEGWDDISDQIELWRELPDVPPEADQ